MKFSEALHDLDNGFLLHRRSWTEIKYVVQRNGYPEGIAINADTAEATGIEEGTVCVFHPYLMQRGADGGFTPWLPNMGDLFADDWALYDPLVREQQDTQEPTRGD